LPQSSTHANPISRWADAFRHLELVFIVKSSFEVESPTAVALELHESNRPARPNPTINSGTLFVLTPQLP
jgi:hypothetical protein